MSARAPNFFPGGNSPHAHVRSLLVSQKNSLRKANSASRMIDEHTGGFGDSKTASQIRFSATLCRPAATKAVSWTFLTLPEEATSKLPSRGQVTVEGTFNGVPFRATIEPNVPWACGGEWRPRCS
jgi:hypothetical protein